MSETETHVVEHPERHEHRDADTRTVALFGLALLSTVVFVLLLVFGFLRYLASKPAGSTGPLANFTVAPPEPHLQVSPSRDLQKLRASEDAALSSYGWVDQKAGIVRLPIDRAMDLVVQRGLPTRGDKPGRNK